LAIDHEPLPGFVSARQIVREDIDPHLLAGITFIGRVSQLTSGRKLALDLCMEVSEERCERPI